MTTKIKLTQEQADAIEILKENQRKDFKTWFKDNPNSLVTWAEPLAVLTADEYMGALYDGYEVEAKLEVGDWAKATHEKLGTFIGKITKINYTHSGVKIAWASWNTNHGQSAIDFEELEKCTSEEVRKTKEQRLWNHQIRRKVGEIKEGDIGEVNTGKLIFSKSEIEAAYSHGALKGLFPIEKFVDFWGDDHE